jgi:Protein of unknown function (DUF2752)
MAKSVGRAALSAGIAFGLAHLHVVGRPATVCPLRALTGIPCPFCGGTTAAVRLGHLDVVGALRANPFVIMAGIGVVLAPAIVGVTGISVGSWSATARRTITVALLACLVLSELWQLVRFGIV